MPDRPSAVTRDHARRAHGLIGDGWQYQHRVDHVLAENSYGPHPTWAHHHDPLELDLSVTDAANA